MKKIIIPFAICGIVATAVVAQTGNMNIFVHGASTPTTINTATIDSVTFVSPSSSTVNSSSSVVSSSSTTSSSSKTSSSSATSSSSVSSSSSATSSSSVSSSSSSSSSSNAYTSDCNSSNSTEIDNLSTWLTMPVQSSSAPYSCYYIKNIAATSNLKIENNSTNILSTTKIVVSAASNYATQTFTGPFSAQTAVFDLTKGYTSGGPFPTELFVEVSGSTAAQDIFWADY